MNSSQKKKTSGILEKISTVHLTWKRYIQKKLSAYRITPQQIYVLRRLARNNFLFPAQIARLVFCDRPTATVIIKNMERQGWVAREQDPDNRKRRRVCITPAGQAKLASIPDSAYRTSKTEFDPLACFTEQEQAILEQLLTKLTEHLRQLQE